MENEIKYKLEPDEEKFLDEVSAVFEPQRDRFLIREAVKKKIATSDFLFSQVKKHGGLLAWKYLIVVLSIIGLSVGSYIIFSPSGDSVNQSGNTTLQAAKKPAAGLASAENNRLYYPATVQVADNSEAQSQSPAATMKENLAANGNNTTSDRLIQQANAKQERRLQVMTKKMPFTRIEKSDKKVHRTFMDIPEGINYSQLEQNIGKIFNNLGMKFNDLSDNSNPLMLQSIPVKGYYSRIDSKPVEFYIGFRIISDDPSKLMIYLVFDYVNDNDNSQYMNIDMENIFYEKVKNECLNLFK